MSSYAFRPCPISKWWIEEKEKLSQRSAIFSAKIVLILQKNNKKLLDKQLKLKGHKRNLKVRKGENIHGEDKSQTSQSFMMVDPLDSLICKRLHLILSKQF